MSLHDQLAAALAGKKDPMACPWCGSTEQITEGFLSHMQGIIMCSCGEISFIDEGGNRFLNQSEIQNIRQQLASSDPGFLMLKRECEEIRRARCPND